MRQGPEQSWTDALSPSTLFSLNPCTPGLAGTLSAYPNWVSGSMLSTKGQRVRLKWPAIRQRLMSNYTTSSLGPIRLVDIKCTGEIRLWRIHGTGNEILKQSVLYCTKHSRDTVQHRNKTLLLRYVPVKYPRYKYSKLMYVAQSQCNPRVISLTP